MNDKAKELLENGKVGNFTDWSTCNECYLIKAEAFDRALVCLESCQTCGGSREVRCNKCCGDGHLPAGGHSNKCYNCDGKGKVFCTDCLPKSKPEPSGKTILTFGEVEMNMQQLLCNCKCHLIEALELQSSESKSKNALASRHFGYTSQYLQYAIQLSGVSKDRKPESSTSSGQASGEFVKKAREFTKDANRDFVAGRVKSGGCVEDYVKALGIIEKAADYIEQLKTNKAQQRDEINRLTTIIADKIDAPANKELKGRIEQLEADNKKKDELLFAYESVAMPINPLIAENKQLKDRIEQLEEKRDWYKAKAQEYMKHLHKLKVGNKQLTKRIKELEAAVGFLNSMILSGEEHSEQSKKVVEQALKGGKDAEDETR